MYVVSTVALLYNSFCRKVNNINTQVFNIRVLIFIFIAGNSIECVI